MTPPRLPLSPLVDVGTDVEGRPCLFTTVRGIGLLRYPLLNKGTAFSDHERLAHAVIPVMPRVVLIVPPGIAEAEAPQGPKLSGISVGESAYASQGPGSERYPPSARSAPSG